MVKGLAKFAEHFAEFQDQYVLIEHTPQALNEGEVLALKIIVGELVYLDENN